MKKENQSSFFSFFISSIFEFLLYECPGLCQLQGMDKVKNKVAWNETMKKLLGFYFCINIANLETYL